MNNERVAAFNKGLFLFHLFRQQQATISELSELLGLSVTAVSRIAKELCEEGVIYFKEPKSNESKSRGRAAGTVCFTQEHCFVICLEVRPHSLHCVLTDIFGNVILPERIVPLSLDSKESLITTLIEQITFYQKHTLSELKSIAMQASRSYHHLARLVSPNEYGVTTYSSVRGDLRQQTSFIASPALQRLSSGAATKFKSRTAASLHRVSESNVNKSKVEPVLGQYSLKVAIAMHGQVDYINGVSILMPQAAFHEPVHVKYFLEQQLGVPVMLDNDCVMRTLAQKWYLLREASSVVLNQEQSAAVAQGVSINGAATADSLINLSSMASVAMPDFCVINLDYGIGSSFLINGEIYRGTLFGSGQIGHTIVEPQGKLCSCGRYGCLETIASTRAILAEVNAARQLVNTAANLQHRTHPLHSHHDSAAAPAAQVPAAPASARAVSLSAEPAALAPARAMTLSQVTAGGEKQFATTKANLAPLTFAEVVKLYHEGDLLVCSVVNKAAQALGMTLYNFLNVININRIYLYGEACLFGDKFLQLVMQPVLSNPFDRQVQIKDIATLVKFGSLSMSEQIAGISFIFGEHISSWAQS